MVKRSEPTKIVGKARVQKKSDDSEIKAQKDESAEWEGQNDGDAVAMDEDAKDEEHDDSKEDDEPSRSVANKNGGNVAPEKKRESKTELKTLIGDWGDDEEDAF